MKRLKRMIALGVMAALGCGLGAVAQTTATAKEVQTDKTGRFVYSQARDEDRDVAFSMAYAELMTKLKADPKGRSMDDLRRSVQRIDNQAFDISRVLLFVDFDNINTAGEPLVEAPSAPSIAEEYAARPEEEPETPAVEEPVAPAVEEPVAPAREEPAEVETAPGEEVYSPDVIEGEEEVVWGCMESDIPEGRLGELVNRLQQQTSIKGVQAQLEKGRSSRVISQYGSGKSKYHEHAYLVVQNDGMISVYTPQGSDGQRTDLRTGAVGNEVKGLNLYWFLAR